MDIDLRKYWSPLHVELEKALAGFARRQPETRVCTVGVWADSFHGAMTLHLDTQTNSAAHIERYPDAAREDDAGRFSAACQDFAFRSGEFGFPGYPDLYNHSREAELAFISLEGEREVVDPSRGDAGKDPYVLRFLRRLISSFEPFPQILVASPLRCCVEMHATGEVRCWRVGQPYR